MASERRVSVVDCGHEAPRSYRFGGRTMTRDNSIPSGAFESGSSTTFRGRSPRPGGVRRRSIPIQCSQQRGSVLDCGAVAPLCGASALPDRLILFQCPVPQSGERRPHLGAPKPGGGGSRTSRNLGGVRAARQSCSAGDVTALEGAGSQCGLRCSINLRICWMTWSGASPIKSSPASGTTT